jgi:hypothetical protein
VGSLSATAAPDTSLDGCGAWFVARAAGDRIRTLALSRRDGNLCVDRHVRVLPPLAGGVDQGRAHQ